MPKEVVKMSAEENVVRNENSQGEVRIANDVIAMIAGLAAMEVEGVDSMEGNITRELIGKLSGNKLAKGVRIEVGPEGVTVFLTLLLKYGYRVMDVSKKVQERVSSSIENMTGKKVLSVSVSVTGISMGKEA